MGDTWAVSFDVFCMCFENGEKHAVDPAAARQVLEDIDGIAEPMDAGFVLTFPDGGAAELYVDGLSGEAEFDGGAFMLRGLTRDTCRFMLAFTDAAGAAMAPAMEPPTIILPPSARKEDLPGDLRETWDIVTVTTADELLAALSGGLDAWRAYRDQITSDVTRQADADSPPSPPSPSTVAFGPRPADSPSPRSASVGLQIILTLLIGVVVVLFVAGNASGCYDVQQPRPDTLQVRFARWVIIVMVLILLAVGTLGVAFVRRANRRGAGLVLLVATLLGFLLVPGIAGDELVVDDQELRQTTGFAWDPMVKGFQLADVERVTIGGSRRTKDSQWLVVFKSGRVEAIDPGDLWEANEDAAVAALEARGIPVDR